MLRMPMRESGSMAQCLRWENLPFGHNGCSERMNLRHSRRAAFKLVNSELSETVSGCHPRVVRASCSDDYHDPPSNADSHVADSSIATGQGAGSKHNNQQGKRSQRPESNQTQKKDTEKWHIQQTGTQPQQNTQSRKGVSTPGNTSPIALASNRAQERCLQPCQP
jgi:hypothetical protein